MHSQHACRRDGEDVIVKFAEGGLHFANVQRWADIVLAPRVLAAEWVGGPLGSGSRDVQMVRLSCVGHVSASMGTAMERCAHRC